MPTQYDMKMDDDLFRGILQYEHQPVRWESNPNTSNGFPRVSFRDGPEEPIEFVLGPYSNIQPIKAYITRHRKRRKNLRIKAVQKVSGWEEVSI